MFIKHERHVHTQVSEWIHSGQKKKRRPITEKKEKPTSTMTEQALNILYSLAYITDNCYCNKMYTQYASENTCPTSQISECASIIKTNL
jgi:ERCC4-type nuclease